MTLSEEIHKHFSKNYTDVKEEVARIGDSKYYFGKITSNRNVDKLLHYSTHLIGIALVVGIAHLYYSLTDGGIIALTILSFLLIKALFVLVNRIINQPIENPDEFGKVRTLVYGLSNGAKLPKKRISPDREINYWIYRMWSAETNLEQRQEANDFVEYIETYELEPKRPQLEKFIDKISKAPPEYRENVASDYCEPILESVYKFETISTQTLRQDKFIRTNPPSEGTKQLKKELNRAYEQRLYATTAILTRKFMECRLRNFYLNTPVLDSNKIEDKNGLKSLGGLIDSFEEDKEILQKYNGSVKQELREKLDDIRKFGNIHVHNSGVVRDEKELENIKQKTQFICKTLQKTSEKIEQTNGIQYQE